MEKEYLSQFVLVGGTALALQMGNRKSVDLDFFTTDDFHSADLFSQIEEDFPILSVKLKLRQTLILEINNVKVDFIRFKYPFLKPVLNIDGIRLLSLEDIAPMKLDAMSARGAKKDFFDIYFLMEKFTLGQMLDLYVAKYQHSTLFHVIRSLTYFVDAEEDADPIVFDKKHTWEKVKTTLGKEVRKL